MKFKPMTQEQIAIIATLRGEDKDAYFAIIREWAKLGTIMPGQELSFQHAEVIIKAIEITRNNRAYERAMGIL